MRPRPLPLSRRWLPLSAALGPLLAGLVSLTACAPTADRLELFVAAEDAPLISDFVAHIPAASIGVRTSDDPLAEASGAGGGVRAALVRDPALGDKACSGCYQVDRIERDGPGFRVRGSDRLGLQYGLAQLLESFGVRFFHPYRTHVPERPWQRSPERDGDGDGDGGLGVPMRPDKALRGLHLHTLHPIEAYYALWQPGEENLARARQIVDWIVKNRGNYLQWVALDNLVEAAESDPPALAAWRAHSRAILDYAHTRGLRTGIALQLFGFSNLQKGFDLVDDKAAPVEGQIRDRLQLLLSGLPFDSVNLAFGEFFGTDPKSFIDTVNRTYQILREIAPGTEMSATVHVGDSEKQKVDYMGERLIYYFLVKYADPGIVPWIHTVMYYDLFEDAGGAYHHKDFAAHREYLLSRLAAGQRTGYKPETAYWVAFDNSVPTYLPLYMRSRWLDLDGIRRATPAPAPAPAAAIELPEHVLFSSGWEWGYWQNDYAALRASYRLPADWTQPVAQMFSPFGEDGAKVAAAVRRLGELEHDALITQRLAPYLAGRDLYLDAGRPADLVSQPDRPELGAIVALSPTESERFEREVLAPLGRFAADLEGVRDELAQVLAVPASAERSPFLAEVVDGTAVTAARARFIHSLYTAALSRARGASPDASLVQAEQALAAAQQVIERRQAALHAPAALREELVGTSDNPTIYPFGYLKQAHTLCYWRRERIQARRALGIAQETVPPCIL